MEKRRNGSLVTSVGAVTHVHPDHSNRVKTDTWRNYFRPFLRIIARRPTSMISDDTLITISTLVFAGLLIVFSLYCYGGDLKFSLIY